MNYNILTELPNYLFLPKELEIRILEKYKEVEFISIGDKEKKADLLFLSAYHIKNGDIIPLEYKEKFGTKNAIIISIFSLSSSDLNNFKGIDFSFKVDELQKPSKYFIEFLDKHLTRK